MGDLKASVWAIFRPPSRVAPSGLAFASGAPADGLPCLSLALEQWESQTFNFYELDGQLDALAESQDGPFALVLLGSSEELARSAPGALTRKR